MSSKHTKKLMRIAIKWVGEGEPHWVGIARYCEAVGGIHGPGVKPTLDELELAWVAALFRRAHRNRPPPTPAEIDLLCYLAAILSGEVEGQMT